MSSVHVRRLLVAACLLVLSVSGSLWWVIHPPRTQDGYRVRASSTLALLRSDTASAQLWLDAVAQGKVTHAAARVALQEAENGSSRRSSSVAAYQPPTATLAEARTRVVALADEVVSELGRVRVDASAGRWSSAVRARVRLATLIKALQDLREEIGG